jgi:hypothetical protein
MKEECKHQFDDRHPTFLQCTRCDYTIPVLRMNPMSQEAFAELFPSLSRTVGTIIIDDPLNE